MRRNPRCIEVSRAEIGVFVEDMSSGWSSDGNKGLGVSWIDEKSNS